MEYSKILMATTLLLTISILWKYINKKRGPSSNIPMNFPILGTIPSIFLNLHRFIDYTTEIMQQTQGTFVLKGPWPSKLEMLLTGDPSNAHYVMCKRHENFDRGPHFIDIFQTLGEGIINSESDKWRYQRKIAISSFTSARFRQFMVETLHNKLERGLVPLLDRAHMEGRVVDLEDLFYRLMADVGCMLMMGLDSGYLSLDPSNRSFDMMSMSHVSEDVALMRHVLPVRVWKLKQSLGIGKEGKLAQLEDAFDAFIYENLRKKREEKIRRTTTKKSQTATDLVTLYMEKEYGTDPDLGFKSTNIFLRDTFVNLLFAGKDTVSGVLSWFFWLLTRHPIVEAKIKEELMRERDCTEISQLSNANKLVYLHATICETIRLYPPTPYLHRAANRHEKLPSGHRVKPWMIIILSSYAMARFKWVWGEDCEEFKPERWITEEGTIKHEPSHKFFAFNAGPRMCIGKEMAFMQTKAIARHVLLNGYRFEVVQGHRVEPASSIILRMKNGLKVKVMK